MSNIPLLLLLSILVFIYHFGLGIYHAFGAEPSPSLEFLYSGLFLCGFVWWVKADDQKSVLKDVYCLGLMVGYGWLVVIPYYLFKTRGVRGFIPLLALMGSFVAAYTYAAIFYMIVVGLE